MSQLTRLAVVALVALLLPVAVLAGPKSPEIYTDMHGRALKGYDAVAYHLERRPVEGLAKFSYDWKDATWLFASAENRDKFIADPERWAPQYGGYCAWAIVRDRLAPINPTIFRIFDDKLYLNLNMKVHRDWLGKHQTYIVRADEKWPGVLELKR